MFLPKADYWKKGIIQFVGPSVLRAPAEQTKVATILGIFPFLLLLLLLTLLANPIQNPRRDCRRVSNFCMGP